MKEFQEKIQKQFDVMQKTGKLFRVDLTGQQIWDIYLNSFNKESNSKFRDPLSSTYNCQICNNFIRRYGNIVAIIDNKIVSMFDVNLDSNDEYRNFMLNVNDAISKSKIVDIFTESFVSLNSLNYEACKKTNLIYKLGIKQNFKKYTEEEVNKFGVVNFTDVYTFNHFALQIDKQFVDLTGDSIESILGKYRDSKNVFKRGLDEISLDTLNLVRDLINQGSLLDGTAHLFKIDALIPLKKEYDELATKDKDNWCWVKSYGFQFSKFKNELIGTLCTELTEGTEINEACKTWNKRVDPTNYMKATAPITKRQIEEAKNFVIENGYEESFNRRCAVLSDIKASEILHLNETGTIKSVSIFDNVKAVSTQHKRAEFDGVEEVNIEKFMTTILPTCTSVEAFLTNNQEGNMVTLTTSAENSKPIFKWDNPFSWTFNGNLAGKSQIKENVKNAGGKITGLLRCSLQWNDEDTIGIVDLDLHCKESKEEINYNNKRSSYSGGWLDVDMRSPRTVGVENITWQNNLIDGNYEFFVRNYSRHLNHKGFKVEIEFEGNVFNYSYLLPFSKDVKVATITVKNKVITIIHHLPESSNSKDIYGLETNKFHKVNLVSITPNHWGVNNVGNKHYLFMLEGCKSPNDIRSFHNENLLPELAVHRKVLEVLGTTSLVKSTDKQLSGLGYNSTVKDELILKLSGSHKRVIKIIF